MNKYQILFKPEAKTDMDMPSYYLNLITLLSYFNKVIRLRICVLIL